MAAATVQQIARVRANRDYLTDLHATVLGMTAPAPVVQAAKPQPTQAAPAPAAQQPSAAPAAAPPVPSGSAQQIAMAMLASYGWSSDQFSCLDPLWQRESGWNVYAANPDGAYGIPQALPGSKMASAGADWQTDAATQIRWGLGYIQARYGSPCAAWAHSQATGWY
jgi:resuscitation-promoting factor RpfB